MKTILITFLVFIAHSIMAKDYKIYVYSNEVEEYIKNVQIYNFENNSLIGETDENGEYEITSPIDKNTRLLLKHPNFKDTTFIFGKENHSINLKTTELFKEKIVIEDYSIYHFSAYDTSNVTLSNIKNEHLIPAEFIGGQSTFYKFIGENVRYPQYAIEQAISGKVYIKFIIEKDGSILHAIVVKGVSRTIDKEAIRVIKLSSKMWSPGKIDGDPVRSYYLIPLNFNLQ